MTLAPPPPAEGEGEGEGAPAKRVAKPIDWVKAGTLRGCNSRRRRARRSRCLGCRGENPSPLPPAPARCALRLPANTDARRPAPRSSAFLVTPHIGSRLDVELPFRDTERRISLAPPPRRARAAVKPG